ncbi:MAG: hypothetical protein E7612_08585 [Ruminococcaceae bacterium]|nr:hypothetical protein [Oscillospiraceae bacterium]
MKRVAILGCENSHANKFLAEIRDNPAYSDYEVVGIYSNEDEAAKKLSDEFGVPVLDSYDAAVGKVDGLIITARDGKYHYEYAKPYIASGIPMFIDKPITADPDEAVEFMRVLRDGGIRICGGSSLGQADEIIALRESVLTEKDGKTMGGVVRAPLQSDSPHSGIYFYAAHLVEMLSVVFGRYPKSVKAYAVENQKTVVFRYESYDVVGIFTEHAYKYFAARFSEGGSEGGVIVGSLKWFKREFSEFDALMNGDAQHISYDDFISSVFVIDAIARSLECGEEVTLRKYEV